MGPMWGRQDPDGPHVGPMDFVIWVGSADDLPPPKRPVVTWTNAEVLSIGPLGKNFSESWTIFTYFDSRKFIWKCCLPNVGLFCSCLSVSATIFLFSIICQSIGTDTFLDCSSGADNRRFLDMIRNIAHKSNLTWCKPHINGISYNICAPGAVDTIYGSIHVHENIDAQLISYDTRRLVWQPINLKSDIVVIQILVCNL